MSCILKSDPAVKLIKNLVNVDTDTAFEIAKDIINAGFDPIVVAEKLSGLELKTVFAIPRAFQTLYNERAYKTLKKAIQFKGDIDKTLEKLGAPSYLSLTMFKPYIDAFKNLDTKKLKQEGKNFDEEFDKVYTDLLEKVILTVRGSVSDQFYQKISDINSFLELDISIYDDDFTDYDYKLKFRNINVDNQLRVPTLGISYYIDPITNTFKSHAGYLGNIPSTAWARINLINVNDLIVDRSYKQLEWKHTTVNKKYKYTTYEEIEQFVSESDVSNTDKDVISFLSEFFTPFIFNSDDVRVDINSNLIYEYIKSFAHDEEFTSDSLIEWIFDPDIGFLGSESSPIERGMVRGKGIAKSVDKKSFNFPLLGREFKRKVRKFTDPDVEVRFSIEKVRLTIGTVVREDYRYDDDVVLIKLEVKATDSQTGNEAVSEPITIGLFRNADTNKLPQDNKNLYVINILNDIDLQSETVKAIENRLKSQYNVANSIRFNLDKDFSRTTAKPYYTTYSRIPYMNITAQKTILNLAASRLPTIDVDAVEGKVEPINHYRNLFNKIENVENEDASSFDMSATRFLNKSIEYNKWIDKNGYKYAQKDKIVHRYKKVFDHVDKFKLFTLKYIKDNYKLSPGEIPVQADANYLRESLINLAYPANQNKLYGKYARLPRLSFKHNENDEENSRLLSYHISLNTINNESFKNIRYYFGNIDNVIKSVRDIHENSYRKLIIFDDQVIKDLADNPNNLTLNNYLQLLFTISKRSLEDQIASVVMDGENSIFKWVGLKHPLFAHPAHSNISPFISLANSINDKIIIPHFERGIPGIDDIKRRLKFEMGKNFNISGEISDINTLFLVALLTHMLFKHKPIGHTAIVSNKGRKTQGTLIDFAIDDFKTPKEFFYTSIRYLVDPSIIRAKLYLYKNHDEIYDKIKHIFDEYFDKLIKKLGEYKYFSYERDVIPGYDITFDDVGENDPSNLDGFLINKKVEDDILSGKKGEDVRYLYRLIINDETLDDEVIPESLNDFTDKSLIPSFEDIYEFDDSDYVNLTKLQYISEDEMPSSINKMKDLKNILGPSLAIPQLKLKSDKATEDFLNGYLKDVYNKSDVLGKSVTDFGSTVSRLNSSGKLPLSVINYNDAIKISDKLLSKFVGNRDINILTDNFLSILKNGELTIYGDGLFNIQDIFDQVKNDLETSGPYSGKVSRYLPILSKEEFPFINTVFNTNLTKFIKQTEQSFRTTRENFKTEIIATEPISEASLEIYRKELFNKLGLDTAIVVTNIQTDYLKQLNNTHPDYLPELTREANHSKEARYLLEKYKFAQYLDKGNKWVRLLIKEIEQVALLNGIDTIVFVSHDYQMFRWGQDSDSIVSLYNETVPKIIKEYFDDVRLISISADDEMNIVSYVVKIPPHHKLRPVYYHLLDNVPRRNDEVIQFLIENTVDGVHLKDDAVDIAKDYASKHDDIVLRKDDKGYYLDAKFLPTPSSMNALIGLLEQLSKKFGIKYELDFTMKAKGAFDRGVVRINPMYATSETAIHEFLHPFIEVVKKENPSLYKRLVRAVKRNGILDDIKNQYAHLYDTEEQFIDEAIVTLAANRMTYKNEEGLLRQLINFIKKILKKLFGTHLDAFKDLEYLFWSNSESIAPVISDVVEKSQAKGVSGAMYQLSDQEAEYYSKMMAEANAKQKIIIERLAKMQNSVTLSSDEKHYIVDGKLAARVSSFLDSIPYYKYQGEQTDYSKDALEYGNEVDNIARHAIFGTPLESIKLKYLTPSEAKKVYDHIVKLKEKYPDHIFLPQVTIYDETAKPIPLAGTADIIAIDPDGQIKIFDVKTSRHYFPTRRSGRHNKQYADSYDRHDAQLTAYRALFENKGFNIADSDALAVIPIKFEAIDPISKTINKVSIPVDLIKHHGDKVIYSKIARRVEQKEEQFINDLKFALQKKILLAKKSGNKVQAATLESLLEHLNNDITFNAVNSFIDDAHATFLGTDKWTGYADYVDVLESQVANEEIDKREALNKLNIIKKNIEIYGPVIKELVINFREKEAMLATDSPKEGSMLAKLEAVDRAIDITKRKVKEISATYIADILSIHITPARVEALKKYIKNKREQVARYEKMKSLNSRQKTVLKKLKQQLHDLESRFLDDRGNVSINKAIYNEIVNGYYADINGADRYLNSALNTNTLFLSGYALLTKHSFESARIATIPMLEKMTDLYRSYAKSKGLSIDRPDKVNEKILTKRYKKFRRKVGIDEQKNPIYEYETKEVLAFVSPIDYNAFNRAKDELREALNNASTQQEKTAIVNDWKKENLQTRPLKHIEGVTKIGDVVLIETIQELEKRKLKELGHKGFERWKRKYAANADPITGKGYSGEYLIPKLSKFEDAKFYGMDEATKKYYTEIMKEYLHAQSLVPARSLEDKFIAPYMSKSVNDRILEDGLYKAGSYVVRDSLFLMEEDTQEENIEREKIIPVMYWNNYSAMSYDDVSKDVVQSVMRFGIAARRYKAKMDNLGLTELLQELVEETTPAQSVNGMRIFDKAAKLLGLKEDKYIGKDDDNNAAALLSGFIERNIYEIHRKDPKLHLGDKTIDVGKVTNKLMSLISLTSIAFDPLTSVANSLTAQYNIAEEAYGSQFFNKSHWAKAQKLYAQHEGDLIKDMLDAYPKSFLGQLNMLYDPMQGEYYNAFGRKVTQSNVKYYADTSIGFLGMAKGEHRAAMVTLLALLESKKDKDGKSLLDKLKEKYDRTGQLTSEDYDVDVIDRMHALSKQMQGIYDKFNSPEATKHFIGRLLLMFRKYLYPSFKRRFQNEYFDFELGEAQVGFIRKFYSKLYEDYTYLLDAIRNNADRLAPHELSAMRRALAEHAIVFVTGLLAYVMLKFGWGDDDDDDFLAFVKKAVLYETLRTNAEIGLFMIPGDINDYFLPDVRESVSTLKSVSAGITFLSKVTNAFQLAVGDAASLISGGDIQRYERDYGIWEKGDSKTVAALLKLMGISGKNLDMDVAIDQLFITRGISVKTNVDE